MMNSSPLSLKNTVVNLMFVGITAISFTVVGCAGVGSTAHQVGVATGNATPDIITESKNGDWLQLHALKGSYVLVEFWESGNSEARKNHFEMDRLYKKYKNAEFKDGKNFCVYSVSLDTDKQKWLDALAADNVSWPCQTIDSKSWNAKSAIDFEVNFLPKYYLVNGDGQIVNRNILIDDLEDIIKAELN